MAQTRTRRFFLNALTLIGASLTIRTVGMIFNIYITNRVGSETVGLYSLLSGTYGFMITLATAGINLAITRTVSEALGQNNRIGARRAMKTGIIYSLSFGFGSGLILFCFAEPIGAKLIGDVRTVLPFRILALTLPGIALCSCINGYFTAVRRVSKSSAAQISAQAVKIAATVILLTLLLPNGIEYACIALVLGGAVAEFLSLAITLTLYLIDRGKVFKSRDGNTDGMSHGLLKIALPIAFSSCLRSMLISVEHILIPKCLKKSGRSWSASLSSFGLLHGLVLPTVLFPSAFISSFSGLIIPEIAESRVIGDTRRIERISYRIFTFAMIFSVATSGIMICFAGDFGLLISSASPAEVSHYITLIAPLIPIMYVDSSVDAILKGMGQEVYSMNVNIIDAICSVIFVALFVPSMGVYGYVLTIYITETLNTTLSITRMLSVTGMKPQIFHQIFAPILCIIISTLASKYLFLLIPASLPILLGLVLHVAVTLGIYILLLFGFKVIGYQEKEVFRAIKKGKTD